MVSSGKKTKTLKTMECTSSTSGEGEEGRVGVKGVAEATVQSHRKSHSIVCCATDRQEEPHLESLSGEQRVCPQMSHLTLRLRVSLPSIWPWEPTSCIHETKGAQRLEMHGQKNSARSPATGPSTDAALRYPLILSDRGSFADLKALAREGRGPFLGGGWWVLCSLPLPCWGCGHHLPLLPRVWWFMQSLCWALGAPVSPEGSVYLCVVVFWLPHLVSWLPAVTGRHSLIAWLKAGRLRGGLKFLNPVGL